MNRRIFGVIASVLLAAVGTFVLVAYVRGAEDRALAGERTVEVLVVDKEIAKGTAAEQLGSRVRTEQVPAKVQAAGSVDSPVDLKGKVAAVDLLPGEQITTARFVEPEALAAQGDTEIPRGLQEVTVALEPERALGGRLSPGQTVGVLASFEPFETSGASDDGQGKSGEKTPNTTHMILHKVLVTNVQLDGQAAQAPAGDEDEDTESRAAQPAPAGSLLVTLALKAPAVERVVFTAEHGYLWLSAEPETADEDDTTIQTRGTVYE